MFSRLFGRHSTAPTPARIEPTKDQKKKEIEHYLLEAESFALHYGGTPFHAHLIAGLRWVIEAPVFEDYCNEYPSNLQPAVRMGYASYILCLMVLGLEQHLSVNQVKQGLNGVYAYLDTQPWYDREGFKKIWRQTFDNMPHEMTPGKRTGIVSLLAFVLINIHEAGYQGIINASTSPQIYMALDLCMAQNRHGIIATNAAIAKGAIEAGWVAGDC